MKINNSGYFMDKKLKLRLGYGNEIIEDPYMGGFVIMDWLTIHEGLSFLQKRELARDKIKLVYGDQNYLKNLNRKVGQFRSAGKKYVGQYRELSDFVGGFDIDKGEISVIGKEMANLVRAVSSKVDTNYGAGSGYHFEFGKKYEILSYMLSSFFVYFEDIYDAQVFNENMTHTFYDEMAESTIDGNYILRHKKDAFRLFLNVITEEPELKPLPRAKPITFSRELLCSSPSDAALRASFYRAYDECVKNNF